MKIVRTEGGEYNDCIVKYFDLFDYQTNDLNKVLFWGWASLDDEIKKSEYAHYSNKYFINMAMPCEIISGYIDILKQSYFDEVFTICPYTANVLNGTQNKISNTVYTPICFPFREKYFDKYKQISITDKTTDVIYYGNLHSSLYYNLIKSISKFNYAFSTISYHNQNKEMTKLITHFNLPSEDKWDLLSKSKISVGFNLIFLGEQHIENLKSIPNIESFKNIDIAYEKKMLPQMKTRMVEAAACKTLMLMYKDDWNVIEEWFEPNKHFLYWETFEELEELISDVSSNYKKYWHIVEAANEHVQQYSLENMMDKII